MTSLSIRSVPLRHEPLPPSLPVLPANREPAASDPFAKQLHGRGQLSNPGDPFSNSFRDTLPEIFGFWMESGSCVALCWRFVTDRHRLWVSTRVSKGSGRGGRRGFVSSLFHCVAASGRAVKKRLRHSQRPHVLSASQHRISTII